VSFQTVGFQTSGFQDGLSLGPGVSVGGGGGGYPDWWEDDDRPFEAFIKRKRKPDKQLADPRASIVNLYLDLTAPAPRAAPSPRPKVQSYSKRAADRFSAELAAYMQRIYKSRGF
jgi:hypothetical protein